MWTAILCTLGLHRPSAVSLAKRGGQRVGLCEHCACPLVGGANGRWRAAGPL